MKKKEPGRQEARQPAVRKALVTPEGGEPVEVEVPAGHPAPESVAVVAWRKKADAWGDGRPVVVTFPEGE